MIIAVDFDGTIVTHDYPRIGRDIGAFPWLLDAKQQGAQFILLTMRSDKMAEDAIDYCAEQGLLFWSINHNPKQTEWTHSSKVYANLYIDDAALGAPLIRSTERPFMDWSWAGPILVKWIKGWKEWQGKTLTTSGS